MPTTKQPRFGPVLIPTDSGSGLRSRYYLRKRPATVIGRGSKADIAIEHPQVSREHAVIFANEEGYLLEHRGANPTHVIRRDEVHPHSNATIELKRKGDRIELRPGDAIEVAHKVKLRFQFDDAEPGTEPIVGPWELKVILNADVVGYSRLVAENAETTREALDYRYDEIFLAEYLRNHGDFIERVGDNVLVLFSSVKDAVAYAKSVQLSLAYLNCRLPAYQQMQFRIGCDCGDILVSAGEKPGEKVCGDAVNLAERIQRRAEPGGLSISGLVYEQIAQSERNEFRRAGTLDLENIGRTVEVYQWIQPPDQTSDRDGDGV